MEQEAHSGSETGADLGERLYDVGVVLGAGVLGYGSYVLFALVFSVFVYAATGGLSQTAVLVIGPPALALGMATGAGLYIAVSEEELDFLDLRRPSLRDALVVLAGIVVLVGVAWTVEVAMSYYGVEAAEHSTTQTLETADPMVTLYLVVASILFIGPGEELLFRNVVQKRLYRSFSGVGAILVASTVFAAVHFQAYATGTLAQVLTSLAVVFVLSLLLGSVYYLTDNLVVPALVHGCYNAVVFYLSYATQAATF